MMLKLAATVLIILIGLSGLASAQVLTTPNLINPAGTAWGIPSTQILDSAGISLVEGGGPTTGSAYYNSDTNTIRFSYMPSVVMQTIAINTALQGAGIQVRGFNWKYQWMNTNGNLSGGIALTDPSGNLLQSRQFNHPVQAEGTWNIESGSQTFENSYSLANLGSISMSFFGQDGLFWNGLYGPRVRDPSLTLSYSVDVCVTNPLSSPECPGYFQAQCTVSPLYNPACPGYQQAFFTQQCSLSALYSPECPGYQQAYFTYQCEQDALYSTSCPNYATALARRQVLAQAAAPAPAVATATDPVAVATATPATSTTSPTSVTSVTSVISGNTNATTSVVTAPSSTQSTTTSAAPAAAQETKKTNTEIQSATAGSAGTAAKNRAEARAREVAKAAAAAQTMEQQTAAQGLVVGLMSFVPGFEAYSQANIQDVLGRQMLRQYGRDTVDNQRALRQLNGASDRLHRDMIEQQWR